MGSETEDGAGPALGPGAADWCNATKSPTFWSTATVTGDDVHHVSTLPGLAVGGATSSPLQAGPRAHPVRHL